MTINLFQLTIANSAAKAELDQLSRRLWGGDLAVLPKYRELRAAVAAVGGTELVELPQADTLNELWAVLGFAPEDGPAGVHRRLAAALSSIARRGTSEGEFSLAGRPTDARRAFVWESFAGRWGRRHWRVTGQLRLVDGRLAASQVVVAVESTARREKEAVIEWTAFYDGPLDAVLTDRLNWVTAQFAARRLWSGDWSLPIGWGQSPLTEEEMANCHDLHTSPAAAWETPTGRIVLEDDSDGSARLSPGAWHYDDEVGHAVYDREVPAEAVADLVRLFWAKAPKSEVDQSIPASGPIPEPVDEEGLLQLLLRARWETQVSHSPFREWNVRPVGEFLAGLPEGNPAELWAGLKKLHPELASYVLASSVR